MAKAYRITIEGDTLAELIGAVVETAALYEAVGASMADTAELIELAAPVAGDGAPLPTPPPDYQAAGLTAWQAVQARTTPPSEAAAPAAVMAPAAGGATPYCRVHAREMIWKGGGLSKNGKNLPLWSCPDANCKEAIWPQR